MGSWWDHHNTHKNTNNNKLITSNIAINPFLPEDEDEIEDEDEDKDEDGDGD